MISMQQTLSVPPGYAEPFENRIDILFRELELAAKWKRPSILLVIYSSEYVHTDAEAALEARLHDIGQMVHRLRIRGPEEADIASWIAKRGSGENRIFFVDGLRRGNGKEGPNVYLALNNHREFFIENCIRIVFWMTEREAIDLAHYAPDYWAFRHRVIEFVESPRPEQLPSRSSEPLCQELGDFASTIEDLDERIALRLALLNDLPFNDESTAPRASLLLTLGVLHWRKGDFEKASEFLSEALPLAAKLNDSWFEARCYYAIGLVETDLERIESAIQAYEQAAALAPGQFALWNKLGELYNRLGRFEEALEAFQKAISSRPTDAASWNGLGDLYLRLERPQDAISAYQQALKLTPQDASSWNGLGNAYAQLGQWNQAVSAYQRSIEANRRMTASWIGLGDILKLLGDHENALAVYKMARDLEPRNARIWSELGDLYLAADDYEEAARAYRNAIELGCSDARCYVNLATLCTRQGRGSEAIPLYRKAIEQTESVSEKIALWNQLGDAYRRLSDYDNAIAAYRQADELEQRPAVPTAAAPDSQPTAAAEEQQSDAPASIDLPGQELFLSDSPPLPDSPSQAESSPQEHPSPDPMAEATLSQMLPPSEPPPAEPALPADLSSLNVSEEESLVSEEESLQELPPEAPPPPPVSLASPETPATEASSQAESPALPAEVAPPGDDSAPGEQPAPVQEGSGETAAEAEPDFLTWLESLTNIPSPAEEQSSAEPIPAPAGAEPETTASPSDSVPEELPMNEAPMTNLPETTTETSPSPAEGQDTRPLRSPQEEAAKKSAQVWNELGNIYFKAGDEDEAEKAFHKAIELDQNFGWPYSNLATVYAHKGRYHEAIPLFKKGIELVKDVREQALLWNHLGDAYRRLNDHDQAMAAYRKAMELDPSNTSLLTRARFSLLVNCQKSNAEGPAIREGGGD